MTLYNQAVIEAADTTAKAVQAAFFAIKGEGAVTLSAIAGAGKSFFVTDTVKKCRQIGWKVAVAAPTNEQVFSLVRSIAESNPAQTVVYLPAQDVCLPVWAMLPNVQIMTTAHHASGSGVVLGTIDKLASARNPRNSSTPALQAFDALIIDESYQANAAKYYAIASIAPRHLCVGDSGQILPFTTVENGRQWRGLAEDPLQTAIGVLHANHPKTPQFRFPITRRLDTRGAALAKHFYPPDHAFGAALIEGTRSMKLGLATAVNSRDKILDQGLNVAAKAGWAYLEQPALQTLVADPDTAQLITDLIVRLNHRAATLVCERQLNGHALAQHRIAVAVSHNDQKAMLSGMLAHKGLNQVVVNTANKLQGLEFDFVVCWHPLAGSIEADGFHLEAGRLCVMCTRHRHACVVVGRSGDRELVEGIPPSTPSYPGAGADADDVLRGWETHREIFAALAPTLVPVP